MSTIDEVLAYRSSDAAIVADTTDTTSRYLDEANLRQSDPDACDEFEETQWLGEHEEWLNTMTHGFGCLLSLLAVAGFLMFYRVDAWAQTLGFAAYGASLVGVYLCSTLSHAVRDPRRRNRMRAWDQGVIYCLIAGTYTPFAVRYLEGTTVTLTLIGLWTAAAVGFYSKVFARHRVNALATATYLLLGWLPTLPFINRVPLDCVSWMAAGGVLYTIGVIFLKYDGHVKYFHAIWHLFVIMAATVHFAAIVIFTQTA